MLGGEALLLYPVDTHSCHDDDDGSKKVRDGQPVYSATAALRPPHSPPPTALLLCSFLAECSFLAAHEETQSCHDDAESLRQAASFRIADLCILRLLTLENPGSIRRSRPRCCLAHSLLGVALLLLTRQRPAVKSILRRTSRFQDASGGPVNFETVVLRSPRSTRLTPKLGLRCSFLAGSSFPAAHEKTTTCQSINVILNHC